MWTFFYFVHIQFVMTKSTLFIIFPTSTLHIMQIISSELALRAESQICITIARDVLYCTLLLHNSSALQDIIQENQILELWKANERIVGMSCLHMQWHGDTCEVLRGKCRPRFKDSQTFSCIFNVKNHILLSPVHSVITKLDPNRLWMRWFFML